MAEVTAIIGVKDAVVFRIVKANRESVTVAVAIGEGREFEREYRVGDAQHIDLTVQIP